MQSLLIIPINNAKGLVAQARLFGRGVKLIAEFSDGETKKTILLSKSDAQRVVRGDVVRDIKGVLPLAVRLREMRQPDETLRSTGTIRRFNSETRVWFPVWSESDYDLVVVNSDDLRNALTALVS